MQGKTKNLSITVISCRIYLWQIRFSCRPTLQSPARSFSPPSCPTPPSPQRSRVAAVMEAPARSPRPQKVSVPWTLPSPAIKTHHSPLSSPSAQSHPPRSRVSLTLPFLELDLTATHMVRGAPCNHPTHQDVPPLRTTGAHEAQWVTWIEAPLPAPHLLLLTGNPGLPHFIPPQIYWALMMVPRWAAGRLGRTEAPLLCHSIIQCQARFHETLVVTGNLVSGCSSIHL